MLMHRILGLDLGDVWVGIAIADSIGITCRPLTTVKFDVLVPELEKLIKEHDISVIIVGYPKTMTGTNSAQTNKIVATAKELEEVIAKKITKKLDWKLWDERLSSKWAQGLSHGKPSPHDKKLEHARAAAFILQSYLDSIAFARKDDDEDL